MALKYALKNYTTNMARTFGKDLAISTRDSIEIADTLRGMDVTKAIKEMELVKQMKKPIVYRKRASVPHKKGYGPAKYPIKCADAFAKLLKQVQANAQVRGLNAEKLEIIHINATVANRNYHYGRRRGIKTKATHIQIVVAESSKSKQKEKKTKQEKPKQDKKEQDKPNEQGNKK